MAGERRWCVERVCCSRGGPPRRWPRACGAAAPRTGSAAFELDLPSYLMRPNTDVSLFVHVVLLGQQHKRPPKPPLWWLLRRAAPVVYGSAGMASFLALRAVYGLPAVPLLPTSLSLWTSSERFARLGRVALLLYGSGVVLDVSWSPLLHGAKRVGAAAALRAIATVSLGLAVPMMFLGVHPLAAVLLLPLFAWECSGAYWNYILWRMNRAAIREKRHHRDMHGYSTIGEE